MKGLSAKKIAAIAAGAALVGTALAPFVSAMDLKKADVYDGQGAPAVSVVVGSNAAISDVVWAGNIAAAIARNATTTAQATGTATPDVCGGAGATWNPPTALSVDLSVGGTTTLGAGSKQFKVNMNSVSGGVEIDHNQLSNSTLTHLINTTQTETVNNSQSTITAQETIGANIDVRFDTTSTVKDIVATIAQGDYNYDVSLGTGITLDQMNYSYFSDRGTQDNVKVPFFGQWYTLTKADFNSTTKNLTLNEIAATQTVSPGEEITGLVGDGIYAGMAVKVKFIALSQSGSTNYGKFELWDVNSGTLIDTQTTAGSGANLRQVFVNGGGTQGYSLATDLYINTIYTTSAAGSTALAGYVEITKGTGTVLLYDTKGYPYNPNDTTGVYDYYVSLRSSNLNASTAKFTGINIKNSRERWDTSGSGVGPIYPSTTGMSLTGKAGNTADFGNALSAGTAGKGYAKVKLEGFEGTSTKSILRLGQNPGASGNVSLGAGADFGGVYFNGADDTIHVIPFALKLSNTSTYDHFTFDGQTIAYLVSTTTVDTNSVLWAGITYYVNGRTWAMLGDINGARITIQDYGNLDVNGTSQALVLDGVTYTFDNDANADGRVDFTTDGYSIFRQSSSTGTIIPSQASGDTNTGSPTYGKWFFSRYIVNDANLSKYNVRLLGNNSKVFRYVQQSNGSTFWLALDANHIGFDDSTTIQKSHALQFLGTATTTGETEAVAPQTTYYLPDSSDWNGSNYTAGDNKYQVAVFRVNDVSSTGVAQDFNVNLNTENGGLFTFPNTNLSNWSANLDYLGNPTWSLTNGSTSTNYFQKAWTDTGSKASLDTVTGTVNLSLAATLEQVIVDVLGKSVTVQTTGGEDLLGIAEASTGTTSTGTKVTVSKINYTPGTVTGGAGETVVVTPVTYTKTASWGGNLVYTDKDQGLGKIVIVGGPIVNKMAKGITAMANLKSSGEKVAEVDAATGNILVAGYTASDTGSAAQDFIDALDAAA